jgi:hypothetical protein
VGDAGEALCIPLRILNFFARKAFAFTTATAVLAAHGAARRRRLGSRFSELSRRNAENFAETAREAALIGTSGRNGDFRQGKVRAIHALRLPRQREFRRGDDRRP